jgi:precorrin-6B methylase 2
MILDLRKRVVVIAHILALIAIGAQLSQTERQIPQSAIRGTLSTLDPQLQRAEPLPQPLYEARANHDPDGIGKFYMGREIAQTMGPGGIGWLERPTREEEERPAIVLDAMRLRGGEVVADLGAGSGYFSFRIAPKVGKTGKVLAVDIQDEMLETIRKRAAQLKVANVQAVKDSQTDPHLPINGVDIVLLVDVYHELAYPYEVMTKVREALKPGGRAIFVEYRKEDPTVNIKPVHKMSVEQLQKEMKVIGLEHLQTLEMLSSQHIVIFRKPE